jgi:hypothetical protein
MHSPLSEWLKAKNGWEVEGPDLKAAFCRTTSRAVNGMHVLGPANRPDLESCEDRDRVVGHEH